MKWIYEALKKMKKNKIGIGILSFLNNTGIFFLLARLINWITAHWDEKHPSVRMMNSRKFFEKNRERVECVLNLLADTESKDVMNGMIWFRCFSVYERLPHYSIRTQYFINDFFHYSAKEVFVDCGAYDGDTITAFKKHMKFGGGYKIVAFEPDEDNYNVLMEKHPDIKTFQAGVWNEEGKFLFRMNGSTDAAFVSAESGSNVENMGNEISVSAKCIDDVKECQGATFIKMDIEGSEYNALLGARHVICKNKPKLAICIYHSDEDMLRIIELIHEMVPEYCLYVRQHHDSICETVLYATL